MTWSDIDPIVRPTSHLRKTTITVFFIVHGMPHIDILPEKVNLSSEYFRKNIIKKIDLIMYYIGRK
jgi:hypothetical protein